MGLMRRRGLLAEASGGGGDISDYVQDGIIFWLDGIENTRSGHNASATKWENLANSAHDVTYNNSKVIGDKYCIPNGSSSMANARSDSRVTIEVVMDWVDNGATQMITPWYGNNYGTVWVHTNGQIFFNAQSNNSHGVGVISGINTYTAQQSRSYYLNGNAATEVNGTGSWSSQYGKVLFYYNSQYPRPCVSKIYAIRIYNRALNAAEILQNAQVDAARFR